jgi:hypothetical protein
LSCPKSDSGLYTSRNQQKERCSLYGVGVEPEKRWRAENRKIIIEKKICMGWLDEIAGNAHKTLLEFRKW